MYCMHCGAPNNDTARFCRSCGKPLEEQAPPAAGEETVPLGGVLPEAGRPLREEGPVYTGPDGEDGAPSYGTGEPAYEDPEPAYGDQPAYGEQAPPYGGQPYGSQPYGDPSGGNWQSYGNQQPYGGQPYGDPPYGGQPYGDPSGGDWQSYGNQQPYGGRPYGDPSYGGRPYGNQPPYGGAGQPGYGQDAYGYPQPYGAVDGGKPKKRGKKGIVIAVILILLAALLGGGAFLYIRESDPMAPVEHFFHAFKDSDWEKVYDSVYWGDESSPDWMSEEEFIREAKSGMAGLSYLSGVLDTIKYKKVSEGESYVGDDGLTRKKIKIEMSMEFMGMDQSQETDIVVVRSGKKFLFIPVWKIDNEESDSLF